MQNYRTEGYPLLLTVFYQLIATFEYSAVKTQCSILSFKKVLCWAMTIVSIFILATVSTSLSLVFFPPAVLY